MIKTELQSNNLDLRALLDAINNLPEKGSGSGEDISEELTAQDEIIADIQTALDGVAIPEGGKSFAIIGVVYPKGSVCTCTKNDKVLTLENTDGKGFFAIPEAGEWTVAASDRSEIISITEEGQVESLNLASFYIFKSGDGLTEGYSIIGKAYGGGVTGNWTTLEVTDSYIKDKEGGSQTWGIKEPVDMRKYKKLKARVLFQVSELNGEASLALTVTSTVLEGATPTNILASAELSPTEVGKESILVVDISNLNDAFYINWNMKYTQSEVYDLWLE